MTRNGGALVVESLRKHEVEVVFGIPGTHNLEIYRALHGSGIRHVTPRHEQGAGYAADGYARVTGRPGVVLTTTGPGLLNVAAAIGQAYSDSVPMLVISPGMPVGHPAHGNGTLHETKNQSAALGHVAEYSQRVTTLAEIPSAIAGAFARLGAGRPRPIHIEIPYDLLDATAPDDLAVPVSARLMPAPPDMVAIRQAADALAAAKNPALIVGGGARDAARYVRDLASRLGAPVFTTANGKGVLDESHPLAATSALHLPSVKSRLEGSDVVLAVGTELAATDFWNGTPWWHHLIRIDIDPAQINVNSAADVAIVADAKLSLMALLDSLPVASPHAAPDMSEIKTDARLEGVRWLPWLDAIADAWAVEETTLELPVEGAPPPSDGPIVVADNAMAGYYGALGNLAAHRVSGFLFPTGYGTLGYAVPAAMGAALAEPGTRVIALTGDGGLMFTLSELATAAAERVSLPVVVFDNQGYGEIRAQMASAGIAPLGVDLPSPDFVALAVALGGRGVAIESPQQLTAALTEAFAYPGPTLLVVPETASDHPARDHPAKDE